MMLRDNLSATEAAELEKMFGDEQSCDVNLAEMWPAAWAIAVEQTRGELRGYIDSAVSYLDCLPNSDYANVLRDITYFLGDREL
jgi:hypothetical protein